jgi:murein DD-endopeptidase MepM/ murein hydrolase activator NlpD
MKNVTGVFVLVLLVLVIVFGAVFYKLHETNRALNQELSEAGERISNLQSKVEETSEETNRPSLIATLQTDNPNLLSALQTVSNMSRFIPDSVPIQGGYALSQDFSAFHPSVDLSTSKGISVLAAGAGVVIACYEDQYLGNVVLIDHLNSYKTLYAHLDQFRTSINAFVEKGQEIGSVGNTGNSTNPHLHFQMYYANDPVDPNAMMRISKFKQ